MNLDEAKKILAEHDTSDPARALDAVASLLRFRGIADARLRVIAENIETVADALRNGDQCEEAKEQ